MLPHTLWKVDIFVFPQFGFILERKLGCFALLDSLEESKEVILGEGGGDGATVGAVVGVFGCGEIEQEFFHFGSAEGVSGFDGHFAGRHDPDLFSRWDDAFVHG